MPDRDAALAIERRLAAIRHAFLDRAADELSELEALNAGQMDTGAREAVLSTVHRLAGSAGTFGLAPVSAAAGALEDALRAEGAGAADVGALLTEHLPALALALARAATDERAGRAVGERDA